MNSKLSLVLAVVAFLAILPAQAQPASADAAPVEPLQLGTCSGDDCGCYLDAEACRAACPPEGDPGYEDCQRDCRRESILCAKCCCCQCYLCAPHWGCFTQKDPVPPADDRMLSSIFTAPQAATGGEDASTPVAESAAEPLEEGEE